MKKIGIALSGGGALGMAHIGALKALEENGIKPDIVVGTSIGALIGGVYASGISVDEMIDQALKVRTIDLLDINLNVTGVLSGRSAIRTMKKILGEEILIENMPTKFGAVAVDITNSEEKLFVSGSLIDAMRASISVPGIFVPFKKDNVYYIDGGVMNNLPENQVRNLGADVVLSVNLLKNYIPLTKPTNVINAVALGWCLMQTELVEEKPCLADCRIDLELKNYKQYIFNKNCAKELIEIGYNETMKQMPKIKELVFE